MKLNYESKPVLLYSNFIHLTKFGLFYNYALILGVKEERIKYCFEIWGSV